VPQGLRDAGERMKHPRNVRTGGDGGQCDSPSGLITIRLAESAGVYFEVIETRLHGLIKREVGLQEVISALGIDSRRITGKPELIP
jgi:hypothetical protein